LGADYRNNPRLQPLPVRQRAARKILSARSADRLRNRIERFLNEPQHL
jgi:hypothetical protein